MLRKISSVTSVCLILVQTGMAQTFLQGLGATVSVMTADIRTAGSSYTATVAFTNFTYFPRYTLTESENSSVSIGIPIGGGIGIADGSGGGDASLYYGFDFPLVIDFNKGRKSTYENEERFGWYFGAGFGYMLTSWTDGYSSQKLNSYGPIARAGIRFGAGANNPDKATTLGLYFKPGLEKHKFKTFGIAVLTEL